MIRWICRQLRIEMIWLSLHPKVLARENAEAMNMYHLDVMARLFDEYQEEGGRGFELYSHLNREEINEQFIKDYQAGLITRY